MTEGNTSPMMGWLPAFTTLLGFVAAAISEWLRDSRAHKREREARDAIQKDERAQRQNDFQRQTLLDLQRAVQKVMRSSAEMHHIDCMSARSGLNWHKQLYPEDVNDRAHEAGVETVILGVRVLDARILELLKEFKQQEVQVMLSKSEADGDLKLRLTSEIFMGLNDRIGEVLRSINDSESF